MLPLLLALTLTSPDVKTGEMIPNAFVWNRDGCKGENRTPRLTWDAPPVGTTSLALMVVDPDAPKKGGWVHWRVGMPARVRSLGMMMQAPHVIDGKNDFGTIGWGGPCPPPGQLHHYVFTLFALDENNHVLASSKLIPVYKR
jgi:Raf kinase inhibitor-like YbhB/YbcL family protein